MVTKEGIMGIFTLKSAGDVSILNKKLTSVLKDYTSPEEEVLFCLKSSMESEILVALASRILIIKSHFFGQYNAATFHYRDIISIETVKGIMLSSLKIYTPKEDNLKKDMLLELIPGPPGFCRHDRFSFENTLLPTFLPYIERIRKLVQQSRKHGKNDNQQHIDNKMEKSNISEQLEKLSNLRQSGALTEEEYLKAKKKVLEL